MRKLVGVFILSVLFVGISYCQQPDISKSILKKTDVENFIKNFKSVQSELEQVGIEYEAESNYTSFADAVDNLEEVNGVVKKYGYSDVNDFSIKVWAIAACYASIKMDTEGQVEFEKSIEQIRNNEHMTDEQKEDAIKKMKELIGSLGTAFTTLANKDDIEIVRPFMDKLDVVLDE